MYDYEWQKEWKDYYEILEVSTDASIEEIKKSFRKLAKENHPDAHNNEEKYQKIFQLLNEAYEILGNEEKKCVYDQEYVRRKQGETESETDFTFEEPDMDYEEANREYLEAQKRSLERESCRQIIKEELAKSIEFLQARNEVLFSVYDLDVEKDTYFQHIEDLQQLVYAYLNELQELAESAKNYDLIDLKEEIEDQIIFLLDKFEILSSQKIPVDEIIESIKQLIEDNKNFRSSDKEVKFLKKQLTDEYLERKKEADNLMEELQSFYYSCSNRGEIPFHYERKLNSILLKISELVDYFNKLQEVCQKIFGFGFLEKEIKEVLKSLNFRLDFVPNSYRKAGFYGEILHFQDELREFLAELEENSNHFFQIKETILNFINPSQRCSYDYLSSVMQSMYNDFHVKDEKIRNDYSRLIKLSGAKEIQEIRKEKDKLFSQNYLMGDSFENKVSMDDTLHLCSYNTLLIYELNEKEQKLLEFYHIFEQFGQFTALFKKLCYWEDIYDSSLQDLKKLWEKVPTKNSFNSSSSSSSPSFSNCFSNSQKTNGEKTSKSCASSSYFNNSGQKNGKKTSQSPLFSTQNYVIYEILDEINIKKRNLFWLKQVLKFFLGAEAGICVYQGIRIFQNPSDSGMHKICLALVFSSMFVTSFLKSLSTQYYTDLDEEEEEVSLLLKLR